RQAVEAEPAAASEPTEAVTPADEPVAAEEGATPTAADEPAPADAPAQADTPAAAEADTTGTEGTEGQDASRKSAWDLPVMPQVHESRKRREKPAAKGEEASATPKAPVAKEAAGDKSRGTRRGRDADRDDERGKKRFGTGKLHLSERDRARRGSGRRRGK